MRFLELMTAYRPGFITGSVFERNEGGRLSDFVKASSPYRESPLYIEIDKGSKYPDIVDNASFLSIFKVEVLEVFQQEGISCFQDYPLLLGKAPKKIREQPWPDYRHIRVDGRIELDLDAMQAKVTRRADCALQHQYFGDGVRFLFKLNTWDGSDLVRCLYYPHIVFCTQRVWELACKYQWTNFDFKVPEDLRVTGLLPRSVEYRSHEGKLPPAPDEQAPLDDFTLQYYRRY